MGHIKKYNIQNDIDIMGLRWSNYYYEYLSDLYEEEYMPQIYKDQYRSNKLLNFNFLHDIVNSHNYKEMLDKMKIRIHDINEIKLIENQNIVITLNEKLELEYDKFLEIIHFYNFDLVEHTDMYIKLRPIYSIEIPSDDFYKFNKQAYYFTLNENIYNRILENGLNIRYNNITKEQEFPKRTYLYMGYKHLKYELDEVNLFIKELYKNDSLTINDVHTIKVDLYEFDAPIFKDNIMAHLRAMYIYYNVPIEYLKPITKI